MEKRLTWPQAAEQLGISERQVGRLCVRVRTEGNRGVIHRLHGRPSNHALSADTIEHAIAMVRKHYHDFGPTLANEKLLEHHSITISTFSLRRAMIRAGIWQARKERARHRQWRERRSCVGELVQLDGSDHDWFEGRGPRCVLVLFIDDASSRILHAEFVAVENTCFLLASAKTYLATHGRPIAFYVDKDSIYKINRQATIEEQLRDNQPMSQFSRAMEQLGIEMIFAHSPQAKGRVERSFATHQDRLVKELRLANISDIASANSFLQTVYIPAHNNRFAVQPASSTNAHRPILRRHNLDEILSIHIERTLFNDFTVRFDNKFFQILPQQKVRLKPKNKIIIQLRLDGSFRLKHKNSFLAFKELPHKPYKPFYAARPSALRALVSHPSKSYKPPAQHPWRLPSSTSSKQRLATTGESL